MRRAATATESGAESATSYFRALLDSRRWAAPVLGAVGLLAVLVAWELAVASGFVSASTVPRASAVFGELAHLATTAALWSDLATTLTSALIGLAIAMVIAVPLGVAMGMSEPVRRALRPTVTFLRPVPGIALVPLAVIIWGAERESDIFLVAFGCTWPLLVQTIHGVSSVDDMALMTTRAFGLDWLARVRWVVLPGALAYIITGLRICASIALIIAVAVEIVVGTPGIGSSIRIASSELRVESMYALVVMTGIVGLAVNLGLGQAERRLLHWQPRRIGGLR